MPINEQSELWENQDSCLALPSFLTKPIFWFLYSFTHHGAFKMTQIKNRHWWGNVSKIVDGLSAMSDLSGP